MVLQVAKQEGEYLASILVTGKFDENQNTFDLPEKTGPFKWVPGTDNSVMPAALEQPFMPLLTHASGLGRKGPA